MWYFEMKTFHIMMVMSWFAGLFYLPRIFVNLAMVEPDSVAEYDRLVLMARKLLRFMTPLSLLALLSGLWLWLVVGMTGGWLHAKIVLVVILIGYHHYCLRLLGSFIRRTNTRSHIWYRWYNEVPTILLLLTLILVVYKPF